MGTEEGFHLACCQASAPQQDVRPGSLLPHGDLPCGGNAHGDLRSHGRHTAGIDTHGADAQGNDPHGGYSKSCRAEGNGPQGQHSCRQKAQADEADTDESDGHHAHSGVSNGDDSPGYIFPGKSLVPGKPNPNGNQRDSQDPGLAVIGIDRFPGRTGSDRLPSPPNGVPGFDPSPAPG